MAFDMNQWMAQMAKQAWDLQNARAKEGFNTSLGISNTIPGFRTFADGLQIAQLVNDTDNLRRDNARLRAQQEYLEGNNNNPNNGNAFNSYKTQPAMSFTGQGWSTGELAPNGQDWKQNSFSSLFGGLQNSNWKQSLPNGEGDNPYSFTEPTSEQAQRSVGEVPQSATLDDRLKDSFNLSDYMVKQPQAQVQPQTQPQVQPQMGRPQGNVDYLSDDYAMHNWVQNNGGGKPYLDMMKYAMNYGMLRASARDERIRNNIAVWENPESTPEQKQQAQIQLASDLGQLDLGFDLEQKRRKADLEEQRFMAQQGYMLSPEYDENVANSINNKIVDYALNNYEEGDQWISPDGTGTSRTQCANLVTDIYKNIGLKGIGSSNGDVIAKQFADKGAYVKGTLAGIQPGDFLNFKDHVGIYIGNGRYMARNSTGGIHRGSMEEAIQWFGQPLGYGSINKFAGIKKGQKYIKNPNYVSDREKLERQLANDRWREALANAREERAQARFEAMYGNGTGGNRKNNIKDMSPQEYSRTILEYSNTPEVDEEGNSAISQDLVDKVGKAYAPELLQYIQKSNGNIEEAVKNFYRDKHENGQKGYSLSHDKLVAAIGSAYTYLEDSSNNSNVLQNTAKIKNILDRYATGETSGEISDVATELEPEKPQNALEEQRQKNRNIDDRVKQIEPKINEMNRLFKFSGYDSYSVFDTYFGKKNFLNDKKEKLNEIKKKVGLTDEEIEFYYKNRKNAWDRALDEENSRTNQNDRFSLPYGRYMDNQRD